MLEILKWIIVSRWYDELFRTTIFFFFAQLIQDDMFQQLLFQEGRGICYR